MHERWGKEEEKSMKGLRLHTTAWRLLPALPVYLLFTVLPAWAVEEQSTKKVTEPVLDLAQTTSLAMTLIKVFGALLLTVGLMLLLAACFRKFGLNRPGTRQGTLINIIDTKMIAPKKYVAVIQIADRTLALGITDQQISLLTRLEESALPAQENSPDRVQQKSFATLLGKRMKSN